MVNTAQETLGGDTISEAWMNTVLALGQLPDGIAYHSVTRIVRPTQEDPDIRASADELSAALGYLSIETVANTIFPEQLAASCVDHHELTRRYRAMYPILRSLSTRNRNGTYFGRLVAYPNSTDTTVDQLSDVIRKLHTEQGSPTPKAARYELGVTAPSVDTTSQTKTDTSMTEDADGAEHREGIAATAGAATPVYVPGRDRSAMGFPCLSLCSFQLDHGRLHLIVHYRRQLLIERGYGNYLGLARLLCYVSDQIGTVPGQLTIVAGMARVDAPQYRLTHLAQRCRR